MFKCTNHILRVENFRPTLTKMSSGAYVRVAQCLCLPLFLGTLLQVVKLQFLGQSEQSMDVDFQYSGTSISGGAGTANTKSPFPGYTCAKKALPFNRTNYENSLFNDFIS